MTGPGIMRLDPEPGTISPDAFANAWVGCPFRWDGRDHAAGVDCWGLVWRFYRDCLGITLPDWTKGDRGQDWINATFAEQMADHWRELEAPRDFAIVICAPARRPAHVGVMWRGGVLHCQHGRGVVWEALAGFRLAYPQCHFGEYVEGGE